MVYRNELSSLFYDLRDISREGQVKIVGGIIQIEFKIK